MFVELNEIKENSCGRLQTPRQHFYKMAVGQLGLVTAVGAILILEHFQGRVELHTNSVDTEKVVLETVII